MRTLVLISMVLTTALCHAQPSPVMVDGPVTTLPREGVTTVEVYPNANRVAAAGDTLGITGVLQKELTGQPVIAVEVFWPWVPADAVKVHPSSKLLSRVQDVADAFSTPEQQCVPYAVRGAWVLAPGTREAYNTDFTKYSALDVSGRPRILRQFLTSLSDRDQDLLCSANGLRVSTLSKGLYAMASRALRPPFRLVTYRPMPQYPDQREEIPGSSVTMSAPLDFGKVRLRAELRSGSPVYVQTNRDSSGYEYYNTHEFRSTPRPARREMTNVSTESGFYDTGSDLPVVSTVPNTFKASDLDGKTLTQPFGAHGTMPVEDALKRLSTVTGRKFRASAQYARFNVFVGADTVTCGELADGLRLALTATWRKVGDIYLLTWDKTGFATLQATAAENAQDLTHASDKASTEAQYSENWLDLAMKIPFAKDDPLAWTAGQRATLFGPFVKRPNGGEGVAYVPWNLMTNAQQTAIRSLTTGRKISLPDNTGEWVDREMTPQDVQNTALQGQAYIDLSVDLGDGVWVAFGDTWLFELGQGQLENLRNMRKSRLEQEKIKAEAARNPPPTVSREVYRQPERSLMPARKRGLMVPVLAPKALTRLASLMSARGINLLFYPVLSNGYATFPSKAFPPHPDMGVTDGWAACVSAMKGAGVQVVGYMETLAWRKPGVQKHWLDAHPDWLDVDVRGRTLYAHENALAARQLRPTPAIVGDLVRTSEPEVKNRLLTIVKEFAAKPGASGLCLDAWSYETAVRRSSSAGGWYGPRGSNPLGCSVPDRVTSILARGVDPLDVPDYTMGQFRIPEFAAAPTMSAYRPDGTVAPSPYLSLAGSLLPKARPDGGAWTTWAITSASQYPANFGGNAGAGNPPASVLLSDGFRMTPNTAKRNLLLRVPAATERTKGTWNGQPAPSLAILAAEGDATRYGYGQAWDVAIYDFRDAAGEIEENLMRVGLPPDEPETRP